MKIDKKMGEVAFVALLCINTDFIVLDYDILDITDWEYKNLEDLSHQLRNYESPIKRIQKL